MTTGDLKVMWTAVVAIGSNGAHPTTVHQAVQTVLAMHEPHGADGDPTCRECAQPWPCHTARELVTRLGIRITLGERQWF